MNLKLKNSTTTLITGVMILVALFSLSFASAITWDNVAYWDFNETSGTNLTEQVANLYGTTVNTEDADWVSGLLGNALLLDGVDEKVNLQTTAAYNWSNLAAGSISIWINVSTDWNISIAQVVWAWGARFLLQTSESKWFIYYQNNASEGIYLTTPINESNRGKWVHLVTTYNTADNNISLYVDGILVNTTTCDSKSPNAAAGIFAEFGSHQNSAYWDGSLDEAGMWDRSLTPAEVTQLYNSGSGLVYGSEDLTIDLILPANDDVLSDVGTNFTANYSITGTFNLTNATYYLWDSTGLFNNSVTVEITGTTNSTEEYINNFTLGDYEWNVYACYENTTWSNCSFADSNYSFSFVSFSVTSEEHNSTALETSLQEFELIVTTSSGYTIQNGRLVYNGTVYPFADKTDLGAGSYYLTKSIYIPGGTAGFESENRTFYWNLTVVNEETGESFNEETGEYGQNVTELKFGLCGGVLNVPILNFTLYDEETGVQINSTANLTTFQATFNLGASYQLLKSYSINNLTVNASEYDFCTNNENNTIYANMELFYTAEGYADKDYFLNNATLTNNTNEISLYLLSDANALEFFISVERNLVPLPYVTVNIEKYFVGEGVYKTVEIDETGADGELTAYLDLDKKYRFKIYEDGILLSSQEKKATCEAAPCTIELFITEEHEVMMSGYYEAYASNVLYNLSYDGGTTVVTFDFIDTTGTANYFVMYIYQGRTNQSSQLIYNKTLYTSSGTMTYNLTEHGYTSGDFTVKVYVSRSPESFIDFITIVLNVMAEQLGLLGLFTSLILVLVIIFGFAFKPSLLIMSIPLTMTIMKLMGFISLSTIAITSIYILGGIAVASLSR